MRQLPFTLRSDLCKTPIKYVTYFIAGHKVYSIFSVRWMSTEAFSLWMSDQKVTDIKVIDRETYISLLVADEPQLTEMYYR